MSTVQAAVSATYIGRQVTDPAVPADSYVGAVTNFSPQPGHDADRRATNASFTLVDTKDKPARMTPAVTSVTLSALGIPGHLTSDQTLGVTFDAQDSTPSRRHHRVGSGPVSIPRGSGGRPRYQSWWPYLEMYASTSWRASRSSICFGGCLLK